MSASEIKRFTHFSLSVTDLDRSLGFYRDVLGLRVLVEPFDGEVFEGREAMLLAGRTALCLQEHAANSGDRFDATTTGLDHFALLVPSRPALDEWASRLDEAGVSHSEVKEIPPFGHMIELHDPDGMQLELHALPEDM